MGNHFKIKFLLLLTLAFLLAGRSFALVYTHSATNTGPFAVNYSFINHDDQYINPSVFTVNSVQDAVTLNIVDKVLINYAFSYSVTLKIDCFTDATSTTPIATYTPTLTVNYSPTQGATYQGISDYNFTNAYRVTITVTAVNNNGTTGPTTGMVSLTSFISVDRSYVFQQTSMVDLTATPVNNATAGQQVQLSWGVTPGAEEYDIEWTSIAAGDANESIVAALASGSTNTSLTSQAAVLFRNNASRTTIVNAQSYNLSVVINDDYFVVRIRGVHYNPGGIRVLGNWNYANHGSGFTAWALNGSNILSWHQPLFNWQYSAAYAEEGKKKEVISYFDGTLRSRQTVTVNNTDNVPVVQENVYDVFGRPVASILPAPVKEKISSVYTNVPFLHYFQKLNLNSALVPYSYTDVIGTGTTACEVAPAILSTTSGTSKYYSSANDFITDPNFIRNSGNYIPDAQSYPLSVTQYTADNTGRVKLQGGVGLAFQPGLNSPSNTTRYYYGKPEQWELDQIFGNDVGYAEHYLKNMVADPNNQLSISYVNASGKTVATALTGPNPANMDKVTSQTAVQNQVVHVLKPEQFIFDNSNLKLAASTTYLASTTGAVTFNYDVQKLIYSFVKNTTTICSNCYYDLNIKVVNTCGGTPLYNTTVPVGVKIGDCANSGVQTGTFSVTLPTIGEYNIVFEYVFSKSTMEAYLAQFLTTGQNAGVLSTQWTFLQAYLAKIDFSGVLSDCKTCLKILGTQASFTAMFTAKLASLDIDVTKFNASDLAAYNAWVSTEYKTLLAASDILDKACNYSDCNEVQTEMEQDVSPGGQYALFDNQNSPLEPEINVIYNNFRSAFPILSPTDPQYQLNLFTRGDATADAVAGNVVTSLNDASASWTDVVKYWQPAWAVYFLQFHPEYCKLQFCMANQPYSNWDERVKQRYAISADSIPKITDLNHVPENLAYSYTNPSWLLAGDPFFKTGGPGATYLTAMQADLNNYSVNVLSNPNTTAPVKNLSQYVDYILYCSANCSGADTQTSNCWLNCTPTSCRVANRDWAQYSVLYFQLKQTYYDKLRNATTCANNCSVGTAYTPSTATCASMSDFAISSTTEADLPSAGTCSVTDLTMQSITLTCLRNVLTLNTYVYLFYSAGVNTSGLPTSVMFTAGGATKMYFCIPKAVALSSVQIKAVNCTGTAPAPYTPAKPTTPGTTIQYPTLSSQNCPTGATFTDFYVALLNSNYTDIPSGKVGALFTIKVKPNVLVCTRTGTMPAYVQFGTNGEMDNAFTVNVDPSSYTGTAFIPIAANSVYQVYLSGNVTACTTTPPANNGCAEAYRYKTSRFDMASRTSTYPTTIAAFGTQNNGLLLTQIQSSCTGNADRWIVELGDGLAAYTSTQITTLKNKLIQFCSDNGDQTHPFGATTTVKANTNTTTNPDFPSVSFGDVLKNTLPGLTNFTDKLNPWLIDGPNPYTTVTQSSNFSISYSSKPICDTLTKLNAAYVATGSPLTFYQYLVTTYGSAMNLTATEFANLQASCTACSYVLPTDITLPVFMQPGVRGCISSTDYATAKTAMLANFPAGALPSTDAYYPRVLTNYMNQRFGFALSMTEWMQYDASPTAMFCNIPPYVPVVTDPYAPIESNIATAAANGLRDYNAYIAAQQKLFRTNYISTCAAAQANVNMTVPTQIYHWTLYYYDQADNLVRTVPPEGVTLLTAAQITQVQTARDGGDVASCGTAFTGPTTTDAAGAFNKLSTTLSSGQNAALEFWLYNPGGTGNQVVQTTPDGLYSFQMNISGNALTVDIWSTPSNGVFARNNHTTVNLATLPPLQPWTHIVVQSANLVSAPLQVYVNGYKTPLIINPPPATYGGNTTALKHLRMYSRLLNNSEIMVNAQNNCFIPLNGDGAWYRFNIPPAGGETTVNGGTQETRLTGVYPAHMLTTTYTYNATNQVSQQYSPDGGNIDYWYDLLSRLAISQNDKQLAGNNYGYTQYDTLGRITEVGQRNLTNAGLGLPGYLSNYVINNFKTAVAGVNSQITNTYYDAVTSGVNGMQSTLAQNNLRKRIAATTYRDVQTGPALEVSYYNYDIDGNVSTLWQQVSGLYNSTTNTGLKQIDYEYDLISDKVNFVRYQSGQTDQYFYKYNYDADNRITEAWSGTTANVNPYTGSQLMPDNRRMDAAYNYYLHGPLARMELGDQSGKVQGMDYAYTLQGWLKGVNNQNINSNTDVGQDGVAGAANLDQPIAKDAIAYALGYYTNDYKPIGVTGATAFNMQFTSTTGDITGQPLYNGIITNNTVSISQIGAGAPVGYTYHYDQVNRLKKERQYLGISGSSWTRASITKDYQENITYDGNGNILTYGRNGAVATTAQTIDSLTYNYKRDINSRLLNNQLQFIRDAIATSGYTGDLVNQTISTNYRYDATGNLIYDNISGITGNGGVNSIIWSVYGKIQTIYKTAGNISYTYDARGERVSKTAAGVTTYYVRDALGNTLAVYDNAGGTMNWKEQTLYGSARLGIWSANMNVGTGNTSTPNATYGIVGRKFYELPNYLGNVLATITDRRLQHNNGTSTPDFLPDVVTAQDYYPFGMIQPGRQFMISGGTTYRYGFNGKENDNEVKQDANGNNIIGSEQNYGMRIYDPRVARFLSMDPITNKFPNPTTSYSFAGNSPISFIDQIGEFPVWTHYQMTYQALRKAGIDKVTASAIAYYASTYADHPTGGLGVANMIIALNYCYNPLRLRYDTKKYGNSDDKWYSQSDELIEAVSIHGMRTWWEKITPQQAINRSLFGGWFKEKDGTEVYITGAMTVINSFKGRDLSKLTQKEKKQLGVALHTIQDIKMHKGTRWVDEHKEEAKKIGNTDEHPTTKELGTALGMGSEYQNALKATADVVSTLTGGK